MFWCLLTGHDFCARYSEQLPKGLSFKGKDSSELSSQLQAAKIKVYEGDVCRSCGMVANKPFRVPDMSPLWKSETTEMYSE